MSFLLRFIVETIRLATIGNSRIANFVKVLLFLAVVIGLAISVHFKNEVTVIAFGQTWTLLAGPVLVAIGMFIWVFGAGAIAWVSTPSLRFILNEIESATWVDPNGDRIYGIRVKNESQSKTIRKCIVTWKNSPVDIHRGLDIRLHHSGNKPDVVGTDINATMTALFDVIRINPKNEWFVCGATAETVFPLKPDGRNVELVAEADDTPPERHIFYVHPREFGKLAFLPSKPKDGSH